jgi:hypothetical protein
MAVTGFTEGCYAYRCTGSAAAGSPTGLEIRDPAGAWRPCASAGQPLPVSGAYTGAIACPPAGDELCVRSCASGPCAPGQAPLACTALSPGGCASCADPAAGDCLAFQAVATDTAPPPPPGTTPPPSGVVAAGARRRSGAGGGLAWAGVVGLGLAGARLTGRARG